MHKDRQFFGIDISKDTFDVYDSQGKHYVFKNQKTGFNQFLKLTTNTSHCIMEATAYYHVRLAYFLLENGILVSVENPLKIKRYIQMKLSKVKTDKSDAKAIYNYGLSQNPAL